MRELEVGKIIKKYRERQGLSTDELAEKMNLWNRMVPLWERGLALPDAAWQQKIAETLQIPSPERDIVLQKKDMLNINVEELVIPGLKKEYQFLHLSDAHVIVLDENESRARIDYETPRIADFTEDGIAPTERMDAFLDYINEQKAKLDGVFFTGDIIDCPFRNSIQYLEDYLKGLPVPYMYVLGNHDWQHFDEQDPEVKKEIHTWFDTFSGGNAYVHKKKFGELAVIGVDNTTGYYEPAVMEGLKELMAGEEHVLILQHEVFYSDTLTGDCKLWWHGHDITLASDEDVYKDENIRVLNGMTEENSPVKALITGHLHFHHKDILNGRVPQYIAADASNGGAILYKIHG